MTWEIFRRKIMTENFRSNNKHLHYRKNPKKCLNPKLLMTVRAMFNTITCLYVEPTSDKLQKFDFRFM